MNPFRLAAGLPRKPWLRLGLGVLGLALLAAVVHRVDWPHFLAVFRQVRWPWILGGLLIGCAAMVARTLRLAWILGALSRFGGVWRAMAMGYFGSCFLPMGGGEFVKIGALQTLLPIPLAAAASGAMLDRLFDLFGLALTVGILVGSGVVLHVRTGPILAGVTAGAILVLALGLAFTMKGRADRAGRGFQGILGGHLALNLDRIGEVLSTLRRPGHLVRLLAAQMVVSALDVAGTFVFLQGFSFGPALPFLAAVKLAAFLMLGAALPLLPGGTGTVQVACLLALQPSGVTASGAFAVSLVAQGTGFPLYCLMGLAAAFRPWTARRRSGATA